MINALLVIATNLQLLLLRKTKLRIPSSGYYDGYATSASDFFSIPMVELSSGPARSSGWYCEGLKSAKQDVYLTGFNHPKDQCGMYQVVMFIKPTAIHTALTVCETLRTTNSGILNNSANGVLL